MCRDSKEVSTSSCLCRGARSADPRFALETAHRTKRPWQGAVEPPQLASLPEYDEKCYLCPGNERAGGKQTEEYEGTFVFEVSVVRTCGRKWLLVGRRAGGLSRFHSVIW